MHEFKNQVVHFSIGTAVALVVMALVFFGLSVWIPALIAFSTGITVEVCQFMYHDNHEWKLSDRLLDVSSWSIAGLIVTGLLIFLK